MILMNEAVKETTTYLWWALEPILVVFFVFIGTLFKKQRHKDYYLMFWAWVCFFIHISCMYTSFFQNSLNNGGHPSTGNASDNMLFPKFFCNYVMYLLLLVACWGNKKNRVFQNLATFVGIGGMFGAIITMFEQQVGYEHWYEIQSTLSHSCLWIGSMFLFAGGYVKFGVFNQIPFAFGLVQTGIIGGLMEALFAWQGIDSPNSMFLVKGPAGFEEMHGGYFALAMIGIIFVVTVIFEALFYKKGERWYNKPLDNINIYLPIYDNFEETFNNWYRIEKSVLLFIPVIGWGQEICLRWHIYHNNKCKSNLVMAILSIFFGQIFALIDFVKVVFTNDVVRFA